LPAAIFFFGFVLCELDSFLGFTGSSGPLLVFFGRTPFLFNVIRNLRLNVLRLLECRLSREWQSVGDEVLFSDVPVQFFDWLLIKHL
jgi:hypothetical protein